PAVTLTPCRHRMRPPPHRPTRFPYTTLFRSAERQHVPRGPPERRDIGRRQGGPPIMTKNVTLNVDGREHTVTVDPDMPLLYALRDDLGLNNPRFGCGLAQCGACTVHLDGQPIRSCITPVTDAEGHRVTTL